jgi:hypothetical protein
MAGVGAGLRGPHSVRNPSRAVRAQKKLLAEKMKKVLERVEQGESRATDLRRCWRRWSGVRLAPGGGVGLPRRLAWLRSMWRRLTHRAIRLDERTVLYVSCWRYFGVSDRDVALEVRRLLWCKGARRQ